MKHHTVYSTKELSPAALHLLREHEIGLIIPGHQEVKYGDFTLKLSGPLVCTSQHAIQYLLLQNVDLKDVTGIFCIAGATHAAAQQIQIPILGTANHAESLADKICESGTREILFLCSENHRPELPFMLIKNGIKVNIQKVYSINYNFQQIDEHFDSILFFSPHSVNAFLEKNQLFPDVVCFCIGQTTAQFVKQKTSNEIIVSPFPSQESMIKQLILFFNKNKTPGYAVAKAV